MSPVAIELEDKTDMNRRRTVVTALSLGMAIVPAALLLAGQAGAQGSGAELYTKKCNNCHRPDAPAATKGPDLKGVINRKVASVSDYAYSNGLQAKASERWTEANLNAYILKPRDWAPGTKMVPGVADDAERKAIIDHLKTLK